ncbi:MAG: general secretion pathway protein GspB [Steroidobacteraceae bacterium]
MSFILDALKKSEAERQRQTGPALMEVRVVPPRRRFPYGWVALGVLLGANLWLLLWLLLREPAAGVAAPSTTPNVAAAPIAALPPAQNAAPAAGTAGAAPEAAATEPLSTDAYAAPGARDSQDAATSGFDADTASAENPADLAPAINSARANGSVRNYVEVSGNLPELRLDLHVYAEKPADRYALINMHKVHEGDTLPEGPRVREITRDGVVMRYQGMDFLLNRE